MRSLWLVLLVGTASAHVPAFDEAGSSYSTAFHVDEPTKSWVFYDELAGDQHWFVFEMTEGETLFVSLSLPANEAGRPTLWVMGPGFNGTAPDGAPEGLGAVQAEARDELGVEPFSPLAMRSSAEWRGAAPGSGTFYVLVEGRATYSLAIGARESFTPVEWATIPVERVAIQAWAGIPWPLAVLGEATALVVALVVVRRTGLAAREALGMTAAATIAGSGATVTILAVIAAVQAGPSLALIVPAIFALLAVGVGFGAHRAVKQGRWLTAIGWSVAAVVVWAGLLVGPLMLAAWALWARLQRTS